MLLARLDVGADSAPSASVRNDGVPLVPYRVAYYLHPASFRAFISVIGTMRSLVQVRA